MVSRDGCFHFLLLLPLPILVLFIILLSFPGDLWLSFRSPLSHHHSSSPIFFGSPRLPSFPILQTTLLRFYAIWPQFSLQKPKANVEPTVISRWSAWWNFPLLQTLRSLLTIQYLQISVIFVQAKRGSFKWSPERIDKGDVIKIIHTQTKFHFWKKTRVSRCRFLSKISRQCEYN